MNDIKNKIRVLYIEDDPECSGVVNEMLKLRLHKTEEFEVRHMEDMETSCRLLEEDDCNVDVILLELFLPNSKGYESYDQIRNLCEDIPIVIMSVHEDIALKCIENGAQDYIIKPDFTPEHLSRSLKYAIERQKQIMVTKQFEDIIMNTPMGVLVYELRGDDLIFIGNNPAADKILNFDNSTNIGKTIEDAYPPLASTDIPEIYRNVIRTGQSWSSEGVKYFSGEQVICGTFKVHAFKIDSDKMVASFEDITQVKKMEQKYKELIEATGAAVYEIDFVNMKFTYVNDELCRGTGWTKEELLSMSPEDLLTEDSMNNFIERLQALERGEFIDDTFEYKLRVKDGSIKWILITAKFKEAPDGTILGANVVAIDITDKKIAEILLEEKEKQVFQELGDKIETWRDEILIKSEIQKNRLSKMQENLSSLNGD